jgi:hypothetical protein
MAKAQDLIPPDMKQCQTEIRSYQPFIMGGPVRQVTRCKKKPSWLATEKDPGPDGKHGSMTLCTSCKGILVMQFKQNNKPLPTLEKISKKGTVHGKPRKEAR